MILTNYDIIPTSVLMQDSKGRNYYQPVVRVGGKAFHVAPFKKHKNPTQAQKRAHIAAKQLWDHVCGYVNIMSDPKSCINVFEDRQELK